VISTLLAHSSNHQHFKGKKMSPTAESYWEKGSWKTRDSHAGNSEPWRAESCSGRNGRNSKPIHTLLLSHGDFSASTFTKLKH